MSKSLNGCIPYDRLLTLLGGSARHYGGNLLTHCLACGNESLALFADTLYGGYWGYCTSCGTAGDLLALAAQALHDDPGTAIGELCTELRLTRVTPDSISRYVRNHIQRQRQLLRFWRCCQVRLCKQGLADTGGCRMIAGMHETLSATALEYLSENIGITPVYNLRKALGRAQLPKRLTGWPKNTCAAIIPFFDLPGRICGFAVFGGRTENKEILSVYLPTCLRRGTTGGIAFPNALLHAKIAANPRGGVVINDILTATRLHFHCIRTGNVAPAIGALSPEPYAPPAHTWNWLGFMEISLWWLNSLPVAGPVDAYAIRVAADAHLKLGIVGDLQQHRARPGRYAATAVRRAVAASRPWQAHVLYALKFLSFEGFLAYVAAAQLSQADLNTLTASAPSSLRAVLRQLSQATQEILVDRRIVQLTCGRWRIAGERHDLSNAGIFVEEILDCGEASRGYRVRLEFLGHSVQLRFSATRASPFLWQLRRAYRDVKAPDAPTLRFSTWAKNKYILLNVIDRLSTAVVFSSQMQPGWVSSGDHFVCPPYTLAWGGEILHLGMRRCPHDGDRYCLPSAMSNADVQYLQQQSPVISWLWDVTISMLHNILSPLTHASPRGLIIVSDDPVAWQIVQAMPCAGAKTIVALLRRVTSGRRWPMRICARMTPAKLQQYAYTDGAHWGIYRAAAGIQLPDSRWLLSRPVIGTLPPHERAHILDLAARLLPTILQWICETRPVQLATADSLVSDWLRFVGGRSAICYMYHKAHRDYGPARNASNSRSSSQL